MYIDELRATWDEFGERDPLWAILTDPEKRSNLWEIDEFFASGRTEVDLLMDLLQSVGMGKSGGRALDFGCGVGRLTQALCNHYSEVHGVDIASSMIEFAEKYNKYPGKCKYHIHKEADLGLFEDNYFDLVLSLLTLQHIRPKIARRYIKEFLRVSRPGGTLVFQLPRSPDYRHAERLRTRMALALPYSFTKLYLRIKLKNTPLMEMHHIRRESVESLLRKNRKVEIVTMPSYSAGINYIDYLYLVRKESD